MKLREDFHHSMEQFLLSQSKLGKFGTRIYTCPSCHPWMYENHSTPAYEQFIDLHKADYLSNYTRSPPAMELLEAVSTAGGAGVLIETLCDNFHNYYGQAMYKC